MSLVLVCPACGPIAARRVPQSAVAEDFTLFEWNPEPDDDTAPTIADGSVYPATTACWRAACTPCTPCASSAVTRLKRRYVPRRVRKRVRKRTKKRARKRAGEFSA